MKKALLKDSIKEIKNTYKRFISILLMAFLGVGFFAGLRASAPDMLDTLDKYYKEQNVYDIQIISTVGLTNSDIEKVSEIEDIEKIVGTFEKEGKVKTEDQEVVTKFITLEEINEPIILTGTMPQNANECLVEESFLEENNKQIGDTIVVDIEKLTTNTGQRVDYLKEKELKIVGTAKSPLYISKSRGTSSLGSGTIEYYVYVFKDNINLSSIYTNIYIKTKNSDKYITSTKEYEDYIEDVKNKIDTLKEENEIQNWYILDRNANIGYAGFIQDTESIENISKVFPVVFFIVAALISLTSMSRMVEEQRIQIGTLKALRIQ